MQRPVRSEMSQGAAVWPAPRCAARLASPSAGGQCLPPTASATQRPSAPQLALQPRQSNVDIYLVGNQGYARRGSQSRATA
jgi:hypothetical protein